MDETKRLTITTINGFIPNIGLLYWELFMWGREPTDTAPNCRYLQWQRLLQKRRLIGCLILAKSPSLSTSAWEHPEATLFLLLTVTVDKSQSTVHIDATTLEQNVWVDKKIRKHFFCPSSTHDLLRVPLSNKKVESPRFKKRTMYSASLFYDDTWQFVFVWYLFQALQVIEYGSRWNLWDPDHLHSAELSMNKSMMDQT
jgi:hypothetical protein